MAAKFDAEMMKKQHFWLLLIPVFLGLVLAWIGLFFNVADATEEQALANKKARDEVERAKAKPKKTIALYEERKQKLFELRTARWREMWNQQKEIYDWPKALGDEYAGKYQNAKFGELITDPAFLTVFRDHYAKEYDTIAADAAPLQFAGGWQAVLRHVASWKRNPVSEDVWLAMEDLWVQRELIRALDRVNKDAAGFVPVSDTSNPRSRVFRNRTWEVALQLVDSPKGPTLRGTIRNLTTRLQPFNVTGELLLKVWLSDDASSRPFLFAIEGMAIEAGKTEPIKFIERRHTVLEGSPKGIYRVEQVFDTRTAPVKRLDALALGYVSARHRQADLQMAAFSAKAAEEEAPKTDETGGGAGTGGGSMGGIPGPGGKPSFPMGGVPGPGTTGTGISGPGVSGDTAASAVEQTFNGLVRKRYLNVTEQVRAMPVGLVVIIDQAYVQDVLTAMANTKLRFQTVQTHLARYRQGLTYATSRGSAGSFPGVGRGDEDNPPQPGQPPGGRPSGPPLGGSSGGPPGPTTGGSSAGLSGPPIRGSSGGPPGVGSSGSQPNFPVGTGGSFPGSGFPGGFFAGPRSSTEDEIASNLIELGIYGIVSLYERYTEPTTPKGDDPAGSVSEPGPGQPPVPPMPKDPAAGPMPPDGTVPTPPAAPKDDPSGPGATNPPAPPAGNANPPKDPPASNTAPANNPPGVNPPPAKDPAAANAPPSSNSPGEPPSPPKDAPAVPPGK